MKMTINLLKSTMMLALMISFSALTISKHPIMIGSIVILQSVIMSMFISMSFMFSWMSFILFMIYLGGILMIFSYIISITFSSEKLIMKNYNIFFFILSPTIILYENKENEFNSMKTKFKEIMFSCYSSSYVMTSFLMILLLLVMILVVYMTENTKNSMRST